MRRNWTVRQKRFRSRFGTFFFDEGNTQFRNSALVLSMVSQRMSDGSRLIGTTHTQQSCGDIDPLVAAAIDLIPSLPMVTAATRKTAARLPSKRAALETLCPFRQMRRRRQPEARPRSACRTHCGEEPLPQTIGGKLRVQEPIAIPYGIELHRIGLNDANLAFHSGIVGQPARRRFTTTDKSIGYHPAHSNEAVGWPRAIRQEPLNDTGRRTCEWRRFRSVGYHAHPHAIPS